MAFPARETGLEIHVRHEESCAIFEIAGELDMTAVPRLRAQLDMTIEAVAHPPSLVLDLSRTTFCDSLGLGLLVSTYNRVREMGGRLAMVVVPGMISRLLIITNLDHHFSIYPTVDEAVAIVQAA
ncbi:STAS domain-containing protein [Sphaerisporangium flaviroseum]|uniref:Anti-sigma factor antagonist n=1 Tax=Sphaerisporangium flaviroseum TaxID=509199 RepID=A0ABP7JEB0_9ACTN